MSTGKLARRLHWILAGLALLGMAGASAELAMERHWSDFIKLIPWLALGFLVAALVLAMLVPSRTARWATRLICLGVAAASVFGVWEHIAENRNAGVLDARYAYTWDSLSTGSQWWKAATKTVGPAPVLAPGILIQVAATIAALTIIPIRDPNSD